jgi:hypothetical protein
MDSHELPAEHVIVSSIRAAKDDEQAMETLKVWRRGVENDIRTDALSGFPSMAPAGMERQGLVCAATAARWLKLMEAAPDRDTAVAVLAVELQRGLASYAIADAAQMQSVMERTFRPEPEHIEESLTLLAKTMISTLAETPENDQVGAATKILRAARNVEARRDPSTGQYL